MALISFGIWQSAFGIEFSFRLDQGAVEGTDEEGGSVLVDPGFFDEFVGSLGIVWRSWLWRPIEDFRKQYRQKCEAEL